MSKPLAIDLCCGLGGWTEGLLAEGYEAHGFDIEAHEYGEDKYPGTLFIEDVLTLDGARFAHAALIVASPPCQEFSYMAMPWQRGKQIARALRGQDEFPEGYKGSRTLAELTAIFDACFRIQREASAAAGRHIPLVVENVRGAEPWVGRAKWSFGSYYLWGDVPALMPLTIKATKNPGFRFDGSGKSFQTESVNRHVAPEDGFKSKGMNWSNRDLRGQDSRIAGAQAEAVKVPSAHGRRTDKGNGARFTSRDCGDEGRKGGGDWFGSGDDCSLQRRAGSKTPARKAAAAKIAKIPFALSSWIARTYKPAAERFA